MKAHKQTDDTRLALLEQSINTINNTMQNIEKRFDRLDARFDRLENKVDTGFKDVNNRLWSNFLWMLGLYASTIGLVLTGVYYMINS
jgi:tetrahydromethanopterin S-methyltransferase subunit G